MLCRACADAIAPAGDLLSDHLLSQPASAADAWLVDGYGQAHPVSATGQRIGRRLDSDLAILHGSVSREHAELRRVSGGWQIRDLGSRNATRLDQRRVDGRAALADRAIVEIGVVKLLFVARPGALTRTTTAASTRSGAGGEFRAVLHGPTIDLCALGGVDGEVGGVLLYRATGDAAWSELGLPPLEYHLLRILCGAALADGAAPQRSRGAVLTRALARALPFKTRFPSDENVRQLVRRLRATLAQIGATDVVETVPGRGYFVGWPVAAT